MGTTGEADGGGFMKTTNPPVEPDPGVSSRPAPGVEELGERGVRLVAITIVDNAGIARAKVVPVAAFERSLRWGVGLSPVFGVSTVTDTFTATASVGGPTGDVRLIPDASALHVPAGDPGWAWAPADQHTQDGAVFGCCQRSFACRMVEEACARGLELRLGSELEWFLARDGEGELTPAHAGPGYGFAPIAELGDHLRELVACFVDSGVNLGQVHAEYEPG